MVNYAKTADDLDSFFRRKKAETNISSTKEADLVGPDYAVDACNAIVQFQHFLELFIKDILFDINPLMVYDPARKPSLLLKMAQGESINDSELEGVNFIEFSEALKRLKELQKNSKLDVKYDFLSKYLNLFSSINTLRNRIAHRGAFVLRPSALDEIFGKHILPFLRDLSVNVSIYDNVLTRYMNIKDDKINPFEGILNEYAKPSPNEYAVYVYKLIATAAYNNSLHYGIAKVLKGFLDKKIQKEEKIAATVAENEWADVKICPVCGCKTFIELTDTAEDTDDDDNTINMWEYVFSMECHQCGFHLNSWLVSMLKDLNLPLQDYYWVKEM